MDKPFLCIDAGFCKSPFCLEKFLQVYDKDRFIKQTFGKGATYGTLTLNERKGNREPNLFVNTYHSLIITQNRRGLPQEFNFYDSIKKLPEILESHLDAKIFVSFAPINQELPYSSPNFSVKREELSYLKQLEIALMELEYVCGRYKQNLCFELNACPHVEAFYENLSLLKDLIETASEFSFKIGIKLPYLLNLPSYFGRLINLLASEPISYVVLTNTLPGKISFEGKPLISPYANGIGGIGGSILTPFAYAMLSETKKVFLKYGREDIKIIASGVTGVFGYEIRGKYAIWIEPLVGREILRLKISELPPLIADFILPAFRVLESIRNGADMVRIGSLCLMLEKPELSTLYTLQALCFLINKRYGIEMETKEIAKFLNSIKFNSSEI